MLNDAIQNNMVDILNLLVRVVLFIAGAVFTWVSARTLGPKWNMEAEAARQVAQEKLRNALHMAATTGASLAHEKGLTGVEALRFTLIHVIKSVPESIIGLTPTPAEIFESKSAEAILSKIPTKARDAIENIVKDKLAGASNSEIASDLIAGQLPALQNRVEEIAREAIQKAIGDNLTFGGNPTGR